VSPAVAIAQKDLLVCDNDATFRGLSTRELMPACLALLTFELASLASGAILASRASAH
jgi:hypothetical protein